MVKKQLNFSEKKIRIDASKEGIANIAIGVVIIKEDKILLVRRVSDDYLGGNYELPGGGVEDGETIKEAVERETSEETGLKVIEISSIHEGFDYKTPSKKVRQYNFCVKTSNYEVEIEPLEHDLFVWAKKTDLNNYMMSQEMKECIKRIIKEIA